MAYTMDDELISLFNRAQSDTYKVHDHALSDLRFLIERFTMNRYSEREREDYLDFFYNKNLIDYRLDSEKLDLIKHFLFFLLFNFPDRAESVAKCVKVLFDPSIYEAICSAIEFYMEKNDLATYELIFGITDTTNSAEYFKNKRVVELFQRIRKSGGKFSAALIEDVFNFYNENEKNISS
ncbi:MAG: hypothetical protein BGO54_12750 [Sphingobacteriales bacterium 46-32]|nr:MAG: hypothetical protein BGO54_12750 [Sphingobacteriales bacterium 46-32]